MIDYVRILLVAAMLSASVVPTFAGAFSDYDCKKEGWPEWKCRKK